jgi:hypothetical protein
MSLPRWSGPTVGGVDCNAPETAVWTAVFASVVGEAPNLSTSADIALGKARTRADTAVIYLRRLEEERQRRLERA